MKSILPDLDISDGMKRRIIKIRYDLGHEYCPGHSKPVTLADVATALSRYEYTATKTVWEWYSRCHLPTTKHLIALEKLEMEIAEKKKVT